MIAMTPSKTVISALRAISSIPNFEHNELKKFSESIDETSPLPHANHNGEPVWRFDEDATIPAFFQTLVQRSREVDHIVFEDSYFAHLLKSRVVVSTRSALRGIVEIDLDQPLTEAEFRLALHLMQGHDLKGSAALDRIGYETKRSQFKALASKLAARGQSEVVRILTSKTLLELSFLVHADRHTDLDAYANAYLPKDVRRMTLRSPSGQSVPVLDYGPMDGDPIVALHPMIFPPLGQEEIDQAFERNVRLIWPLRPGLLDRSSPTLNSSSYIDASVEGAAAVLNQVIGGPAPVLAFVSSGAVATRLAIRQPEMVESISFVSTCYSAGKSTVSLPYFGAELVELAFRSEAIMTRTVVALQKYMTNDQRFRRMCDFVLRGSEKDLSHIRAEFDGSDSGRRLHDAILYSPESIRLDFFNQTQFSWSELAKIETPYRFLHGAQDSIHPPKKLAKLLSRIGAHDLNVVDEMGHLPHFDDLRRSIDFAVDWQIRS